MVDKAQHSWEVGRLWPLLYGKPFPVDVSFEQATELVAVLQTEENTPITGLVLVSDPEIESRAMSGLDGNIRPFALYDSREAIIYVWPDGLHRSTLIHEFTHAYLAQAFCFGNDDYVIAREGRPAPGKRPNGVPAIDNHGPVFVQTYCEFLCKYFPTDAEALSVTVKKHRLAKTEINVYDLRKRMRETNFSADTEAARTLLAECASVERAAYLAHA